MSPTSAGASARPSRTRPALAAFLNAVFPGAGHWYLGYRERGRAMMFVTGGFLLLMVLVVAQGVGFALKLFVQPATLLVIYAINAAFFLYRAWAAITAYQLASPSSGRWSPVAAGLAIAAGLTIVLPHVWLGYYDLVQYELVTSVFASDDPQVVSTTEAPPPDDQGPGETAATSIVTTTTEPPPLWAEGERLNVLLIGGDAGPGRRGIRTDTMIVISVDPETGYAAVFSLPRNFVGVPVPEKWGWEGDRYSDLLNALYQYGAQFPELFPSATDPGAAVMKAVFGELLGVPIHYFALVDLNGFVDLVDAVGGVTITVTERVYDETYPHEDGTLEVIDIPPGTYHMDGHTALAYARIRRTSDDYNRMGRQRCVIEALIAEADPGTVAFRFPSIAHAIKENVTTDIPINRLTSLIDIMPLVSTDQIVAVRFIPPDWHSGRTPDRYPIPDVPKIRAAVDTIMRLPPAEAIEALGLVDLEEACDPEEVLPTTTTDGGDA